MASAELKFIIRVIGAIAAAFAAWELRDRIRERNRRLDQELSDGLMSATMFIDNGDSPIKKIAKVTLQREVYRLVIHSNQNGSESVVHDETFNSRESLEEYLLSKTSFRIGDFVRR
jgi:hypothetical protein